ncbi:MAG: ABC transporter ATP-binding protein [Chloroflexi bacterium]|nr:ABC transporter ATP-binding protein [Chloroflexota bacterium]
MGRQQKLQETIPGLWRTIQYFWPYLRQRRLLIAGSSGALFAEVGLRLLEPWPLKFVVDRIIPRAPTGGRSGVSFVDALDPMTLLTFSALAVLVIAGLRALASYWSTVGFALVGNRVLVEVRGELYRHLQCLGLGFHAKAKSGDLIMRVISDVGLLRDVTVTALLPLLGNLLVLLGMVTIMLWLRWDLALLALTTVPFFWYTTSRLTRRIRQAAHDQRRREGALAATVAESLGAIKVVQALSLQSIFARSFASQNTNSLKQGVKGSRLAASLERTVDVLIGLATAAALWYGARLVLLDELTPGDLLIFLTYLKNAFKPLRDFAKYTGRLAKASVAGDRIVALFAQGPQVHDRIGAVRAPVLRGAVRFEEVSFAYEPGQAALTALDFEVEPGQRVALVGHSGSGKSTIASLLLRLYDPHTGRVCLDGHDLREYTIESVRAQIGIVLQDSLLFAATVADNIAYGAPGASRQDVEAAARLANAHEFITALPDGYETVVSERGVTLSGGERQRIAIARAAIRQAPILVLDEPTTGLDEENHRTVIAALERLAQGRTTFLITHDLTLAARADLILFLEGGRIVERGAHAELMRAGGRYAALYHLQTAVAAADSHGAGAHAFAS